MDNMEIWNKLKTPPPTALKKIEGGRLKGKSDINPQWRYEAITEVFGVCGIGWKYTIDKLWTEQGSEGQILCFALISFYHLQWTPEEGGPSWSEAIPGIGGSMLVEKESAGLHSSDEGYKMAVTDALSVALKMIGVGAEVYRGIMGSSKYDKDRKSQPQKTEPEQSDKDLEKARKATHAKASKVDVSHEELKAYAKLRYQKESTSNLTIEEWRETYNILDKDAKALKACLNLKSKSGDCTSAGRDC